MKHANISIFVPHIGCPKRCSFCDQRTISGEQNRVTPDDVKNTLKSSYFEVQDRKNTEIAFFGGSFTAIERGYMEALLKAADEFLGEDGFLGIRISTRPDYIDDEILLLLKEYGVTSIELGAQSMSDEVLFANSRGHTSDDVRQASKLIKAHGFELGLQMMTGLYKSTPELDLYTAKELIKLAPKTVRIYPVSVIEGTELARLYKSGEYKLISLDDMTNLCAELLISFKDAGIDVIRCGLHASADVENNLVAGYYHPAFKDICEGKLYLRKMIDAFKASGKNKLNIAVGERYLSAAFGQKKSNLKALESRGFLVNIITKKNIEKYEIEVIK